MRKNTMNERDLQGDISAQGMPSWASSLGMGLVQRWPFPSPSFYAERGVLSDLGASSSSHVYRRFGNVEENN